MSRKTAALCFTLVLAVPCSYATTAGDDTCIIDQVLKDNRVAMDQMAAGIYNANVNQPMQTAIESAPSVKDAACLPILDTFDTLIRMRIPSTGGLMNGILSKLRDMACNMANSFLESLAQKAQFNYSDPLGVASIGIGGTTNGTGGVTSEKYDLGKVVSDAAVSAIKNKVSQSANDAGQVVNKLPYGPTNRVPRPENTIGNGVKDAINGL